MCVRRESETDDVDDAMRTQAEAAGSVAGGGRLCGGGCGCGCADGQAGRPTKLQGAAAVDLSRRSVGAKVTSTMSTSTSTPARRGDRVVEGKGAD